MFTCGGQRSRSDTIVSCSTLRRFVTRSPTEQGAPWLAMLAGWPGSIRDCLSPPPSARILTWLQDSGPPYLANALPRAISPASWKCLKIELVNSKLRTEWWLKTHILALYKQFPSSKTRLKNQMTLFILYISLTVRYCPVSSKTYFLEEDIAFLQNFFSMHSILFVDYIITHWLSLDWLGISFS